MNSYIITGDSISLLIDNKPYTASKDHPNIGEILQAIKNKAFNIIPNLINISNSIKEYAADSNVSVCTESGVVLYKGEELHNTLTGRILDLMDGGYDITPMVNFLENLMQNPSKKAIDELYEFLEYGKLPLTEDGCFLAYKSVNDNYTSCHDGKTDNSIGAKPWMDRKKVDDRSENTCSDGLHFCSHEYVKSFTGARTVILKINPRDVVSIPKDYNNTKGRACTYEIIGELEPEVRQDVIHNGASPLSASPVFAYPTIPLTVSKALDAEAGETSEEYIEGYIDGYDEGKAKAHYVYGDEWVAPDDYEAGFRVGYKDGKGHKRKLYK